MCCACPAALRVTRTTDRLGALRDAVHRRALQGDVVGQVVQPDRMVVGGRDADAVEAGDICRLPPSASILPSMDVSSS
jgi:hypothetical protein